MADTFTLKAILSAVDHLTPTLKAVQQQAAAARKYLGDVGTSINGLTSKFGVPLGIISTIAAGFGVAAIKKAVVDFADLAEVLQKGALKAGMSVEQFQRMKYVAEQADVPIEALEMSLGKLNKNLFAAGSGKNADLVDLFKTLHIPLRGANGELRNAADMLPQVAEAFARNKSPVLQAAMGTALFGKAYQEMLPFLNEGSEGIAKSLARFKQLKGVIPAEDIAGAKEFGDKLKDLGFVTKGFQMTIAKELVPVLSPVVESFIQWAAANKKLIGQNVKAVVQDLVAGLRQVDWNAFLQGVRSTADSIAKFVEKVGGLRNALIGLAIVMNGPTIAAFVGLAASAGRAAWALGTGLFGAVKKLMPLLRGSALLGLAGSFGSVVLAAWPFIAIAALVAGAAYLIWRNWDVVGPALAGVWERIKSVATVAWNALRFIFSWSPLGVVINNWEAITGWLSVFWSGVKDVVSAGIALIGGLLESWGVLDVMRAVWNPVVDFFRDVWETIGSIVQPILDAAGRVRSAVGDIGVRLANAGQAAVGFVNDQFGAGANQRAYGPRLDGPSAGAVGLLSAPTPLPLSSPGTNVGGSVTVSFKDAPPGMRVEQTQASNPRVPIRTDVGYRFSAAMGY